MWLCCEGLPLVDQSEGCGRQEQRLRGRHCDLVVEEGCVVHCMDHMDTLFNTHFPFQSSTRTPMCKRTHSQTHMFC